MFTPARHSIRAFVLCLALCLAACTKQDLKPLDTHFLTQVIASGITVNFCTDPAQLIKSRLKYVIVLDHSGSNAGNYKMIRETGDPDMSAGNGHNGQFYVDPGLATDPTGYSRYGAVDVPGTLLNFLHATPDNDPNNPLVYFSLVDFSGTIGHTYPAAGFSSDVRDFEDDVYTDAHGGHAAPCTPSATNPCDAVGDAGATDYLGALTGVYNLIKNDIAAAERCANNPGAPVTPDCPQPGKAISSSYVVVFMSDGSPSLGINPGPPLTNNKEQPGPIVAEVNTIANLTSNSRYVDGINLFTIYYYVPSNPDDSAVALLGRMATAGNGQFFNVTAGSNLDYRSFVPPSRLIKFTLADAFVSNESVVMGPRERSIPNVGTGKPGEALLDSDRDGLDDALEVFLGSSPTDPDSDGNGVSDLVEYRTNGAPCGFKNAQGKCAKGASTIPYRSGMYQGSTFIPLCSSVTSTVVAGRVVFPSSSPDGLNDCEKILLGDSNKKANGDFIAVNAPDSNGDIIPDWLEFKNRVLFQAGSAPATSTQDVDGMSFYQKIKLSLPVQTPYTQLLNPHPAQYVWELLSSNRTQDCYKLLVNNLPLSGPNNTVRIDVVMRSPLLSDSYLYRVGRKALSGNSQVLEFNDWNDPAEKTAGTWRSWP